MATVNSQIAHSSYQFHPQFQPQQWRPVDNYQAPENHSHLGIHNSSVNEDDGESEVGLLLGGYGIGDERLEAGDGLDNRQELSHRGDHPDMAIY